ncbi:FkbM family methyltransferase [Pseudomonas sp. PDM23]|uniref:FkbM family methyltransferase n=1 Tax=unclassified Pseudomonas TaxID=196821 RepID=UPI00177E0430|nr:MULTISPECIES: FkbM family methyltransferase [unclassified Pseudomonas]MBD9576654.1 FkbM family methyltransferase [Pseudomonas sp. PDM23]MBD9670581.1 FkbM family methyltransferase [Pseudomonas sp. PDM21]
MSFISYAQNFEDVMLWRALRSIAEGFYIDVGANDPTVDSVTRAFYDAGWHGINIEPISTHYAELQNARPRDINLHCAAGSAAGELSIWQCDVRGWATMSPEIARQHEEAGFSGAWEKTPVRTLSDICREHAPEEIHFLKIDVEGFEHEVIQGMDMRRFRPWLMVIEATVPSSPEENFGTWESALLGNGYTLAYADGLNRFYVADEHRELQQAFVYPPNIFDDFISGQLLQAVDATHVLQAQVEQQQQQLTQHGIENADLSRQVENAQARFEALSLDSTNRIQGLEIRLSQQDADIHKLKVDLLQERTAHHNESARARSVEAENQRLHQRLQSICLSHSWRLTAPLRWLSNQSSLLHSRGLKARLIALRNRLQKPAAMSAGAGSPLKSGNRPHLALDMYVLGQGVKTGVYRVCDELFRRLAKRSELDVRYLLRSSTQGASLNYLQKHDMRQAVVSESEATPGHLCDVLLSPFGVAPGSWREDQEMLQSHIIYDLIAIRRPDLFTHEASSEVQRIMDSLTPNTLVFAISEFTRMDLLEYRPDLSPEQIIVIPLAAGEQFAPCTDHQVIAAAKTRYSIPPGVNYVLSLATLEVRKNLDRVVDAFAAYMNDHPDSDLHLVLAGMSGWKLESLGQSLSNAGRWKDRIILTGFVEDVDLSAIYSGATCFIYLSQYEGFGLPPLEAMACGTPVICANNSSLPEVVGDAGVLIDANDVRAAAESISRICESAQLHSELSAKGLERAKLFTWKKCEDIVTESLIRFAASRRANTLPVGRDS